MFRVVHRTPVSSKSIYLKKFPFLHTFSYTNSQPLWPWCARATAILSLISGNGFVCNVSISLSFPPPTSSTDLNSSNKSESKSVIKVTPMTESLRTTQIAFFRFATPCGFLGGRRRGTKSICARVRARENPMKPFVRTSFLGTRPSCLDDRKPIF